MLAQSRHSSLVDSFVPHALTDYSQSFHSAVAVAVAVAESMRPIRHRGLPNLAERSESDHLLRMTLDH